VKIQLPSIDKQKSIVYEIATRDAISQLQANLLAPKLPPQSEIVEWTLQHHFPEYNTDKKLAFLLGLSSDRRIREFKSGEAKVPYGIWRKFLILTGRVPQDIIKVLAFMG